MDGFKRAMSVFLLIGGSAIVVVGMMNWLIVPDPRATVVTERTEPQDQTVTTSTDARTTTTTTALLKMTTTSTPEAPRRSEAITLAIMATGAVLALTGAFFGRIQRIGIAGAEIELSEAHDSVTTGLAALERVVSAVSQKLAKVDARVEALEGNHDR